MIHLNVLAALLSPPPDTALIERHGRLYSAQRLEAGLMRRTAFAEPLELIPAARNYAALATLHPKREVWALSLSPQPTLYALDRNWHEKRSRPLPPLPEALGDVRGLALDPATEGFALCLTGGVLLLDAKGQVLWTLRVPDEAVKLEAFFRWERTCYLAYRKDGYSRVLKTDLAGHVLSSHALPPGEDVTNFFSYTQGGDLYLAAWVHGAFGLPRVMTLEQLSPLPQRWALPAGQNPADWWPKATAQGPDNDLIRAWTDPVWAYCQVARRPRFPWDVAWPLIHPAYALPGILQAAP